MVEKRKLVGMVILRETLGGLLEICVGMTGFLKSHRALRIRISFQVFGSFIVNRGDALIGFAFIVEADVETFRVNGGTVFLANLCALLRLALLIETLIC